MARWIFSIVAIILVVIIVWLGTSFIRRVMSGDWGGGEIIGVPDVTGMGEEEAASKLKELGLIARINQRSYNGDYPQGQIYRQSPAAGSRSKTGRRVNLWLSLGPANFTVPNLIGMKYEAAGNRIIESGLVVGRVRKIYSTHVPAGEVINQTPDPGDILPNSVPVDITVADRSEVMVTIPDMIGSTINSAEELLARRNLRLVQVNYIGSDNRPTGTVLGQSRTSGKQVPIGTGLTLDVAIDLGIKDSLTKSVYYSVSVPPGPPRQRVKIKVFDNLSPDGTVVYDEEHAPGYRIDKRIDVESDSTSKGATVMLFISDMENPYRTDKL